MACGVPAMALRGAPMSRAGALCESSPGPFLQDVPPHLSVQQREHWEAGGGLQVLRNGKGQEFGARGPFVCRLGGLLAKLCSYLSVGLLSIPTGCLLPF